MKKLFFLLLTLPLLSFSQEDLLSEIDSNDSITENYATAEFKGLKIVNFESTKLVAKKELNFIVSHRFGSVKYGFETFFGLDNAATQLHFVYGVTDGLNIGLSRSSLNGVYDGTLKYRLFRQIENGFPFTLVGYNAVLINSGLEETNLPLLKFEHRLSYTSQLLISRKFNNNLTLELAPTYFHDNYVAFNDQNNSQYAIGMGGRYKIGKRWSFNADYGYHLNRAENSPFKNPLSIGFDLETGGHVFQMHFSNAQAMNANGFLGQATGNWSKGDVFFGFNLSRTF